MRSGKRTPVNDPVNGYNYYLSFSLYWGSDSTDVAERLDRAENVAELIPESIRSIEFVSSLAYPFLRGELVYEDTRAASVMKNLLDMPIVYGQVSFSMVEGNFGVASDNVPKPAKGESINEELFITGIDTIDDASSQFVMFKIHFVSADYLKFVSNMHGISTFDGFGITTYPICELLPEMFSAVGLGDRLDRDSISLDVDIPYISTENDTLLTGLDYVYRKIYDNEFRRHSGKSYCRVVYDPTKRKYVLWSFDSVGTRRSVEVDTDNENVKKVRELVVADSIVGSGRTTATGMVEAKACGNQSTLFEVLGDLKFVGYDYMGNRFRNWMKEDNGKSFIAHQDEFDEAAKSKNSIVLGNSMLFKNTTFDRTFSTSRQNGSPYDVFTEAIFGTSFLRVGCDGSVGRRAGDSVLLKFNNSANTPYESLGGDYLVTATSSVYRNDGRASSFRSSLDLYRPFFQMDAYKTPSV